MAAAAILLLACPGVEAAAIRLVPSASSVDVGSSFTVDVVAEDILIGAYTLNIAYDAGLANAFDIPGCRPAPCR